MVGNAPGLGWVDARATMPLDPFAAPGAPGSFDETRRDASPARRERGVPRAVVRDPFADPFAADLLAPAPVRGGHSEARGSAGARPHAEPPWDPFAPARAPPPVAAHYANPEADLEASLASDRRKRPPGPDRHPPSRAAHYEVSDDEPPVPRARDEIDRARGVVKDEVFATRPNAFCRAAARWPCATALLTVVLPVLCSGYAAYAYGVEVDVSLDSFRIRDHPVARVEDAVKDAKETSEQAWKYYADPETYGELEIVAGPPSRWRRRSFEGGDGIRDGNATARNVSVSSFEPAAVASSTRRLLEMDERRRYTVRWQVHTIYATVPEGRNVLTAPHLNAARRLENELQSLPGYERFCWQGRSDDGTFENGCQPANSVVPLFFDAASGASGGSFGDAARVAARLAGDGVYAYTDTTFNPETGEAAGLRADFGFGAPVDGFASKDDRPGAQKAKFEAFVGDVMYPALTAAVARARDTSEGPDRLDVIFGGEEITRFEIRRALASDVTLAAIGFGVVAGVMWMHLDGSAFLALCGLFEIALSFPAAYFFHRVVLGVERVSVLQFLSVFVILGIGVDDVFVFYESFAAATRAVGRSPETLVVRLSYAYEHAGRAMLVTSFTSAAAFCANVASAIPAVQAFGVFVSVMVALNYIFVTTWFPACIAVRERYLVAPRRTGEGATEAAGEAVSARRFQRRFPKLAAWMANASFESYAEFVHRARFPLLVVCVACGATMASYAARLPPSSEVPKFFPDDHNVQRFIDWTQSKFGDESMSCANYAECAAIAARESDEASPPTPPAPPPRPPGDTFTDAELAAVANVLVDEWDDDDDAALDATELGDAFDVLGITGVGLAEGVVRDYGADDETGAGTRAVNATGLTSYLGWMRDAQPETLRSGVASLQRYIAETTPPPAAPTPPSPPFPPPYPQGVPFPPPAPPSPPPPPPPPPAAPSPPPLPPTIPPPSSPPPTPPAAPFPPRPPQGGATPPLPPPPPPPPLLPSPPPPLPPPSPPPAAPRPPPPPRQPQYPDFPAAPPPSDPTLRPPAPPLERADGTNFENVQIVWGLAAVDRSAKEAMNPYSDAGEAVYDESFDAADADFQIAAASLCDALRNETALVLEVELCFIAALRDWGEARSPLYGSFPFAPEATFLRVVSDFADENEEYRDVVGLALARDGDAPKLRLTHTRVLIKSTTPWNRPAREVAEAYAEWTALLAAFNDRLDETRAWYQTPMPRARLTGEMFVRMATETAAVEGVRLSIGISAAFAVGSIVVFTGNVAVAILALVALVAVVATVLGIFTVAGWSLGIVEAVSITILVGLSCDFALHLAEAYGQSPFRGRAERGKDAVTRVGSPIVAAGTTTFAAVIPMLGCQIRILNKFGAIIPTCIVLSLFYSLHLFVPLLMIAGPDRGAGGPLRRLPEVLFRTQARRVAFFLCAGTALCLVIPTTLAVVAENFTVFAVAVLGLFAATGFWVYVENNAAERRDRRHGGAPEHARADRDEASQREGDRRGGGDAGVATSTLDREPNADRSEPSSNLSNVAHRRVGNASTMATASSSRNPNARAATNPTNPFDSVPSEEEEEEEEIVRETRTERRQRLAREAAEAERRAQAFYARAARLRAAAEDAR